MIDNIIALHAPIRRAIVVEQLNLEQWHVLERGTDTDGCCRCGVTDRQTALSQGMIWAGLTGLPLFSEPLLRGLQPWWSA